MCLLIEKLQEETVTGLRRVFSCEIRCRFFAAVSLLFLPRGGASCNDVCCLSAHRIRRWIKCTSEWHTSGSSLSKATNGRISSSGEKPRMSFAMSTTNCIVPLLFCKHSLFNIYFVWRQSSLSICGKAVYTCKHEAEYDDGNIKHCLAARWRNYIIIYTTLSDNVMPYVKQSSFVRRDFVWLISGCLGNACGLHVGCMWVVRMLYRACGDE